jgi:hypothetical protein
MILNRENGGYFQGRVIRLFGSFLTNGVSNPTVYRDGNSNYIKSVAYVSPGLFTVTLEGGTSDVFFPLPERFIMTSVGIEQAAAAAAGVTVNCRVVKGSYSQANRTFQVLCRVDSTGLAGNPETGDIISFELVGAIDSAGTDPA